MISLRYIQLVFFFLIPIGFNSVASESEKSLQLDDLNNRIDRLILQMDRMDEMNAGNLNKSISAPKKNLLTTDSPKQIYIDTISNDAELELLGKKTGINDLEQRIDSFLKRLSTVEREGMARSKVQSSSFINEKTSQDPLGENKIISKFSKEPLPSKNDSNDFGQEFENGAKSSFIETSASPVSNNFESDQNYLIPMQTTSEENSSILKNNNNQPVPADSLREWDLLILRELALSNSPDILLKKAELEVLNRDIPIIEFQYFPTLSTRAGIDNYLKIAQFQTYSEPEPYGVFSYGLNAKWILYDGFKTRKQLNSAKLEIAKANKSLIFEEQKVLRQLIDHYFKVLVLKEELKILPKIEEIKVLRSEIYSMQLRAGIINRMFLDTINKELESLRIQKMNAGVELDMVLSEMSFLLNVEADFWTTSEVFKVPPDFIVSNTINLENSVYRAVGDAGVQVAKSKYEEIEAESSPSIFLSSDAGYRGRNRIGFESDGYEMSVGLNFEMPISGRFLTKRKLSKAKKEITKSEIDRDRLINQHLNQYIIERHKLDLASKNLLFYSDLLSLQKKKLDGVKKVSAQGISDKSTILLEQEELLSRDMSLHKAELECLKQKYILDLIQ